MNYCRLDEIKATFETVQDVFDLLVKKLSLPTPITTKSLCRALSLLFYTAAKYNECCCHEADMAEKEIKNMLARVKTIMANDWIVKHFTPVFGNPYKQFTKHQEDISVGFEYISHR